LFIVYSLIAKQTLSPLKTTSANSNPAFLKRTSNRVVFQTNRTLFVTNTKINSTILIYTLNLIFLILITSFIFLYYRAGRILLIYYISVPYKINRSMQVVITFLNKKARGLFFVYARLRIYQAILYVFLALSVIYFLKLNRRSNQTLSYFKADY
jgi:hypothetical protein